MVAAPEDIVLSKLEWAKAGGSLRQIEDAAGILKAQPALDFAYLAEWVRDLGIEEQWNAARAAAGIE
jgi:hypothetical protein